MTAAATLLKTVNFGQAKMTFFSVALTGTYASGGDTLTLAGCNPYSDGRVPEHVQVKGVKGLYYTFEGSTTDANGLLHIWTNSAGGTNSVLTEHSNAAIVAAGTTDTVRGFAIWSEAVLA